MSVTEQRMALLMRRLVNRPPLVLLDEVWNGMSEDMVKVSRKYLREVLVSYPSRTRRKGNILRCYV